MTATHTITERIAMLAAALVSLAVAAFVTARVLPIYRFLNHAEAVSAIGLLTSAGLLSLGVVLIVDWRRKRRACRSEPDLGIDPQRLAAQIKAEIDSSHARTEDDFRNAPIDEHGYIDFGALKPKAAKHPVDIADFVADDQPIDTVAVRLTGDMLYPDPTAELQRHLTDALAVMLRHPQLVADAGTLKLLARRPKPVRDEKGRWRRVQ